VVPSWITSPNEGPEVWAAASAENTAPHTTACHRKGKHTIDTAVPELKRTKHLQAVEVAWRAATIVFRLGLN
jgi:hypothetical protein